MIRTAVMVMLVAALFAAAVLNLAMESRIRNTVMKLAVLCAVAVGAVYYGSGYAMEIGLTPTALIRALLAICRMFGGINDIGGIARSPLLQNELGTALFWLGHFCAFYVTASAAIATLGEKLLRRIRVTMLRRGPLLLIFGVNPGSVAYGKSMTERKKRSVLYVDPDGNTSFESTIRAFGAVIDKSQDAVGATPRFLDEINMGPGSRRLELAVLHTDGNKNLDYAKKMMETLSAAGVEPAQTSLLASGIGDKSYMLQAVSGIGYGSVLAFNDYDLTARLIIREFPPCGRIRFDEHGKAEEDFRVVILGYGRMGRAMLSRILCNARFYGSGFRADIFDPGAQNGFLHDHELMKNYDIRFHAVNGKTDEFYTFLQENHREIRCVVLCTGSMEENREIAEDITAWYRFGRKLPLIIQAAKGRYYCTDEEGRSSECLNIYGSSVIDIELIDSMAMQLNQMYCGDNGLDARQNWENCDYFNRMSSRASADFYPAMLCAAHLTEEEVLNGAWPPDDETVENLSITEHLRWCAFHHVMGFAAMPEEVFEQRAQQYRKEMRETGKSSVRIGKDMQARMHACLVPWEDLDDLSRKENDITGGNVDYKQMDRNNVLALSRVISAMKEYSGAEK